MFFNVYLVVCYFKIGFLTTHVLCEYTFNMEEHVPVLISSKCLKQDFDQFQKIIINSENFSLGRGLHNSAVIPFLFLSRDHCVFKKIKGHWLLEDCSSFGIEVNGKKLGKGQQHKLCHQDIIKLESTNEFVYKFVLESSESYVPCKRRKLTDENEDIINNMKKKFEESQSYEIQHIEDKIQSAKHMQTTTKILKEQLELDLSRKEQQLHCEYAAQIEKLKGRKNEVEQQKASLIEERDAQLAAVKKEMDGQIASLMQQIAKHNENETELIQENNSLKDKLLKEREEFLSELNRESSSKQEILDRLEARIREQEEVRLKEKKELEDTLRKETEQLRLAKEKELKELEAEKKKREMELEEELKNIKNNLAKQIEMHENEKREAEQLLNEQKEQLKKVNEVTINQLIEERGEIEKKLALAHTNAETSIQNLKAHVEKRETELAALAADRIQQQADQSSEVITSLQLQLEKVRGQLQSVETEKNTLLESLCHSESAGEGCSKQTTVADVEELMESELTCSICSELFIKAITLNCSHTFCKYCIDKWKKNKRECPICRASITSECKSIVLDSLIERISQTSEETKQKREDILKAREELEAEQLQATAGTSRGSSTDDDTDDPSETDQSEGSGPEADYDYGFDDYGGYDDFDYPDPDGDDGEHGFDEYDYEYSSVDDSNVFAGSHSVSSSDSGSGSDDSRDAAGAAPRAAGAAAGADAVRRPAPPAGLPRGEDAAGSAGAPGRRRRGRVPGIPGSYYGGYGRCFRCGARGHWAPGCPATAR